MKAVPPRAMSPGAYKERQKKQQEARDKAKLLLTSDKQSSSLQSVFKSVASITTTSISISMVDKFNHVAKVNTHQAEHQVSHTYPHINNVPQFQSKSVSPSLFLLLYRAIKEFLASCIIQSNINANIVRNRTNHKETEHSATGNNEKTPDTVLSIDENRSETLPDDLQGKVNNITLLHSMLEKHYVRLDETDQHNLKALVQEKLPRYIADFLLMKKEYRTSLVNVQGKNAHELLMESLGNIETHLQGIEVRANETQLKELSVAARYTHAKN